MTSSTRSRRLATGTALALLLTVGTVACGASGGSEGGSDDPTTTTAGGDATTTTADGPATTTETTDPGDDLTTTTEGGEDTTTTETTDPDVVEGPADEQAYVDALVTTFDEEDDETFSPEQIQCLAEEWVGIVGVEAFAAADVTPEDIRADEGDFDDLDLDESTAGEMTDALGTCGVDIRELFYEEINGDEDLTAEQAACLDAAVSDEDLRQFLVDSLTGEDTGDDALAEADSCVS